MAMILNKENNETDKLTERIRSELRTKMSTSSKEDEDVDFSKNTEYGKDLKESSKLGLVFGVLIFAIIIVAILIALPL